LSEAAAGIDSSAATPNLWEPAWDREVAAPFLIRQALVGRQAGASRLGASLFDIEPGGSVGYLHFHVANEELVIALDGAVTIRLAAGERTLRPGDVVAFPAGADGTHQLINRGTEPARVLVCSTMEFPDVVEHVEYDKVLVCSAPTTIEAFRREDAVRPFANPPRADAD
jgi:uncharacterized cupin superfamily protein